MLVVSLDAYRYSARGMKAARKYSEMPPTQFIRLLGLRRQADGMPQANSSRTA